MIDCYTCAQEAGLATAPPRERIAYDDHWRVAHVITSSLPGWLVLLPRRHVTTVAELTDDEAAALGSWQVRVSRALHAELGCSKTYVVQFAEAAGFSHVHFHLVPRLPDLPSTQVGPKIFARLGVAPDLQVSEADMDALAAGLSRRLR
ncbi:HIT family protein [Fodinicola feengrottensis]|uniref:HIT domain-containing protein n=1 Tax=Fodinicola feengrottensis TaxID=435914 RepID=A0ABP4SGM4_9ACTN|nr:HIT family protein [Fodinicola feengrottensis]